MSHRGALVSKNQNPLALACLERGRKAQGGHLTNYFLNNYQLLGNHPP